MAWRADSRTGSDNPFRVGRGEDDLSENSLWTTFLGDPHKYADIRSRHPELPVTPPPPRQGGSLDKTDWTPNPVKRMQEEISFVNKEDWPHALWHTAVDPLGLIGEGFNTAGKIATGIAAAPYQRAQEGNPNVNLGKGISGGIQRLRQEGPAALRDAPAAAVGGTAAFLQGLTAPVQRSPGNEPRTTDLWGTRERPRMDNPFNPGEALQRLNWYAPGPWEEVASLPASFALSTPGLLSKVPGLAAAAKVTGTESAIQGTGNIIKQGLEGLSHAAMPGLQVEQPLVGNTNLLSVLKAMRVTNPGQIGKEATPFSFSFAHTDPELQRVADSINQAQRLANNIPTGVGQIDKLTGEIPESSYAWVVGGHAGNWLNHLRGAWTDDSAPLQSFMAYANKVAATFHPGQTIAGGKDPHAMLQTLASTASRAATNFQVDGLAKLRTDFGLDPKKFPGILDDWYGWRNIRTQAEKRHFGKGDPVPYTPDTAERKFFNEAAQHYGISPQDMRTWFESSSSWYTENVMNPLLYKARDSGMLTDSQVAEYVTKYDHYGFMQTVGNYHDQVSGAKGLGDMRAARGIGEFHTTGEPSSVSLANDTKHIQKVFQAVARNDAMNVLNDWRTQVPELEANNLLFPLVTVGGQYTSRVAKSIGRVPFFERATKEYKELGVEPYLAQAINQANPDQANAVIRAMQTVNRGFQMSVTTLNPTFLPGHWVRTGASILENMPEGQAGSAAAMYPGALLSMIMDKPGQWLAEHATQAAGMDKRVSEFILGLSKKAGYDPQALESFKLHGPYQEGQTFVGGRQTEAGTNQILAKAGMRGEGPLSGTWPAIVRPIEKYKDLMEGAFRLADESPRFAAYRALTKKGMDVASAGEAVENMGVNFRRAGSIVRAINSVMPLMNAREQGQLTSLHGLWENPSRFIWRASWLVGVPEMALYAHNRETMGDLYDQIDPRTFMGNYVIGTGGVTRDKQGREQPTYWQIPKTPLVQIMTAPMHQMMDSVYHHSAGALPEEYKDQFPDHPYFQIPEAQRTQQSAQHMFLGVLGRISPTDTTGVNEAHELFDAMAIGSMVPMVGVAAQMWANKDHFTGRPIVPPELENVPPEYRYTANTSETAKALSAIFGKAPGAGWMHLNEPAQLEHIIAGYTGGTGNMILGAADQFWGEMGRHGLVPPPDYAPHSWADLKLPSDLPEDYKWQLMQELGSPEHEPWGPQFLKKIVRFLGTGGSANTDISRSGRYSAESRKIVEDTRGYFREYGAARARMQETITKRGEDPGNLTPEDMKKFESEQYQMLRGVGVQLREQFPMAKLNPKEYKAFMANIPGANTQEMVAALPKLPANLTPEMILDRVKQVADPGVDPRMQNPLVRYQRQQQEFQTMAKEYRMPVGVLKDHAGAALAGKTLPDIPVPNVGIQLARDEYFHPSDIDLLTATPKEIAEAKDRVLQRTADDWGVQRQDVAEWLNTSFRDPFSISPLQKSRENASALAHDLYDTKRFPNYVGADGRPVGDEHQQQQWDMLLAQYKSNKNIKQSQWPAMVQALDAAKRYSDVYKDYYVMNDPRYADYQMWYGTGRNVQISDWVQFQSGQKTRYTRGTPADQRQWDSLQKIYARLPATDPRKQSLKPIVERIKTLAVPHWRDIVKADEESRA